MAQDVLSLIKQNLDPEGLGFDLDIKDIETLEIHNKVFAKYLNAYRISLAMQHIYEVWSEKYIGMMEMSDIMIKELLHGLDDKRLAYYKLKEKKELTEK